ncbi:putative polysaccharide biosynthesis protein [Alkalicoccus luteus]|uniref:Polysaccharide biosynthesis protein n=1 Tax=Alkalicoccus luteus TaxID=1237094 RepID=A0A969PR76_9BACI|nr:polysaccharide biosynthesis protein [Alkalicoccus luteus]NJP36931.1 polysaccharide biosynthesis protein [Alkalicoccus luteus]
MSDQQLIRGTMVLTAGIFLTKFLGFIYIFPFTYLVGHQGLALYAYGYLPYTVLLSLATLGIPLAVSKFVSKYNALGDYHTGQRLLKSGLIVMSVTGFIAFLALFFSAEVIANRVLDPDNLEGNTVADAVFTIRMVSAALLVVPLMAIIRGFFQGNQSMGPTAVSQVIEQIVRIVFILILTYLILYTFDGQLGTAIGFAVFGAFAGALGGLAVLLWYWKKRYAGLQEMVSRSTVDHKLPLGKMYRELLRYALPLSFVGLAIPLYQMIDLWTFNPAMMAAGYTDTQAETYFASFTQTSHKLIMIPVSLATAMSLTILPTITAAYTQKDTEKLQRTITQTYQIILFLTVPAAAGLMILAVPAYGALFAEEVTAGASILRNYAPVAVFFAVFAVTASLLQGMEKQRMAVVSLAAGLLFKVVFNSLFIGWFGPEGGVYATFGGYLLSVCINIWAIGYYASFDYRLVRKRFLQVSVYSLVMVLVTWYISFGLQRIWPVTSQGNGLLVLGISVTAGIIVYLNLAFRSGLAGKVLGHRFSMLNK